MLRGDERPPLAPAGPHPGRPPGIRCTSICSPTTRPAEVERLTGLGAAFVRAQSGPGRRLRGHGRSRGQRVLRVRDSGRLIDDGGPVASGLWSPKPPRSRCATTPNRQDRRKGHRDAPRDAEAPRGRDHDDAHDDDYYCYRPVAHDDDDGAGNARRSQIAVRRSAQPACRADGWNSTRPPGNLEMGSPAVLLWKAAQDDARGSAPWVTAGHGFMSLWSRGGLVGSWGVAGCRWNRPRRCLIRARASS